MRALIKRQRLSITGRVQGVGFRPAVHRVASALGLSGFVYNDTKGVTIELQGDEDRLERFTGRLEGGDKPALAEIRSCVSEEIPVLEGEEGFAIVASDVSGTALSQVTADMAACGDCLREMNDPDNFRHRYPFINCTNCGPRYSIVKTIPYDRPNTTMAVFEMCEKCRRQYMNVTDRRFHAQPVACAADGPRVWLCDNRGVSIETDSNEAISKTAQMLKEGLIMGIKGVGGFHLAVDACNEEAVKRLRQRKRRDHKPFAMMAESIEVMRKHAEVSSEAEKLLKTPEAPIVLMPKRADSTIAAAVAEGVNTFGFMLCYSPLHFLLFEELRRLGVEVVVMTSANISDEPLICRNEAALERLGDVADAFLMHDREIYRQVDDSIVHFVADTPVVLRRARGYVPTPVMMRGACAEDVFAAGADMKNTFCFVKRNQLICSEHIGDLEDAEVYRHYVESVEHLRQLFDVEPKLVVCDLHPGYFSTQFARSIPNVELVQVQHHWAHIASVLAEHKLDETVIGLECDGTGFGTDGNIWGCECLIASLDEFERFGHLAYYPLPGGDKASKEAVRPLLGLLAQTFGARFEVEKFRRLLEEIEPNREKLEVICQQIGRGVNTVETSSLGRVFDAAAAAVGMGNYNYFEAQLPMALEAVIEEGVEDGYDFEIVESAETGAELRLGKMIRQLLADVERGVGAGVTAAKFHNCIASSLFEMAQRARVKSGLGTVAISGGVFCNRYLANRVIGLLNNGGFRVLFNVEVPSNDGGIALGQAAIGARHVHRKNRR